MQLVCQIYILCKDLVLDCDHELSGSSLYLIMDVKADIFLFNLNSPFNLSSPLKMLNIKYKDP